MTAGYTQDGPDAAATSIPLLQLQSQLLLPLLPLLLLLLLLLVFPLRVFAAVVGHYKRAATPVCPLAWPGAPACRVCRSGLMPAVDVDVNLQGLDKHEANSESGSNSKVERAEEGEVGQVRQVEEISEGGGRRGKEVGER
ncbi:hypothetical protein CBR_g386 [Chara braunii]|uniref:Uncharacterized protein n=1 Tax=Chara braunii TaxID=69332 RepID=A0A388JQI7_CHABU|nr:hypothetical protein CBR_g386 [Chara braunii]|eukprot:GBG60055.1 hypothetical protein CBR_g386 [Chara braunii]